MNLQAILENELLHISPLQENDFEELFQVARDPLIWEQHHSKRFLKEEFELFFRESIDSGGALIIRDKLTQDVIGSSRFKNISGNFNGVEIGWSFLARKYWGGKYNKAAKRLMMDHAFEFVDHIIFYVNKNNIRSQRAVQKIGGHQVSKGQFPEIPAKNEDTLTFVISKQAKQ